MTSSFTSLLIFTFLTIAYFIIKFFMYDSSQLLVISIIYASLVIILQYVISLSAIKAKCGNNDYYTAFTSTAFPWIFVFGLLYVALTMFPSWKSPFSNTFGYGITLFAGVRTLLIDKILKKDAYSGQSGGNRKKIMKILQKGGRTINGLFSAGEKDGKDESISSVKEMTKALQNIYSDPSLLINEITPDNYDKFWIRMKPLFKSNAGDYKDELFKLVVAKDIVAELMWYLLTGVLVTSMVSNSIVNSKCRYSLAEMEKRQDESDDALNKSAEKPVKQRIYQTKE